MNLDKKNAFETNLLSTGPTIVQDNDSPSSIKLIVDKGKKKHYRRNINLQADMQKAKLLEGIESLKVKLSNQDKWSNKLFPLRRTNNCFRLPVKLPRF